MSTTQHNIKNLELLLQPLLSSVTVIFFQENPGCTCDVECYVSIAWVLLVTENFRGSANSCRGDL